MIDSRYGQAWLTARGSNINSNTSDGFYEYLAAKTGTRTNRNFMMHTLLGNLGYTQPNMNDRIRNFWATKTGLPVTTDFNSLQIAFYSNTANDYV